MRDRVGVFLDLSQDANRPVVELAVAFLFFAGLFQLVDAGQAVVSGMLRGLGDTRVPMLIAGFGYWLIGLHAVAALFHHYVLRDQTLRRMLPGA